MKIFDADPKTWRRLNRGFLISNRPYSIPPALLGRPLLRFCTEHFRLYDRPFFVIRTFNFHLPIGASIVDFGIKLDATLESHVVQIKYRRVEFVLNRECSRMHPRTWK